MAGEEMNGDPGASKFSDSGGVESYPVEKEPTRNMSMLTRRGWLTDIEPFAFVSRYS
jgi:hypothetical protein